MKLMSRTAGRCSGFTATALTCGFMLVAKDSSPAMAAGCSFEPQGEGRVAVVIDDRTFRLQDGREVRLAGIEPVVAKNAEANRTSALARIIAEREVTLRGEDDTPDRYGRQPAFVCFLRNPGAGHVAGAGRCAGIRHRNEQGLCYDPECRRGGRASGKTGNLGRSHGHKKRGKSGRYFDRDRAFYGSRGQGLVRPAGRSNDISEFRTELDTGLCCDYFKADAIGFRGRRNCP